MMLWRILQITDSAFPTGGFAHSNGLEAAVQHGEIKSLKDFEDFLKNALWQIGYSSLPFANVTYEDVENINECDELSEVFLSNHVANRASRVQGRTFYSTCNKAFKVSLKSAFDHENYHFHYAPVFGAIMKSLQIEKSIMHVALFHISLRGILSSAVRLGILGPYQAQEFQSNFSLTMNEIIKHCENFNLNQLAQTNPLLDIYQGNQERLYSRLFQS
jgi:urease accessory protein